MGSFSVASQRDGVIRSIALSLFWLSEKEERPTSWVVQDRPWRVNDISDGVVSQCEEHMSRRVPQCDVKRTKHLMVIDLPDA